MACYEEPVEMLYYKSTSVQAVLDTKMKTQITSIQVVLKIQR
jgi:hypothetical protein